eukprot:XP_024463819.1 uncharacterized protein LOC7457528 [Populus trichocarpa]
MGTAGTLDRFRNLPHKIAHQILLFISMGELARFRLVSKRCKRWMDLRQDDGIKISTLYLNRSFEGSYSYEEFYVGKLLSQAAGSEVEQLKIEVITRSDTAFELPVSVLKCEPLTILMLILTNQGIVRFPSLSSSYFYNSQTIKVRKCTSRV